MITVDRYLAWFFIDVHGSRLEFILHAEDERKGREYGWLNGQLSKMLHDEFKADPTNSIQEEQAYGDLSYLVESSSPSELTDMLSRCEEVVNQWTGRFKINELKDDR